MLSVCIPVFNFDVRALIDELAKQTAKLSISAEILIIDDCSSLYFQAINEEVCSRFHYIKLPENIGRARIRNLFAEYSQYQYLLFLDCDSIIISDHFLDSYINAIKQNGSVENPQVICGGRIYEKQQPSRKKLLRWMYGTFRESQSLQSRMQAPYNSFMTSNFLVDIEVLKKNAFDERLMGYGHEDTLFGFGLKKQHIVLHHIGNPVLNGNVEDNEEYLQKTEKGIENLIFIMNNITNREEFIQDVSLLSFYNRLRKVYLTGAVSILFFLTKRPIRFFLSRGLISLVLFDFYKLGILLKTVKSKSPVL
jgi:predicted glycosyltransferase involved in capsule biosynthesis